jgi:hypothetical protein
MVCGCFNLKDENNSAATESESAAVDLKGKKHPNKGKKAETSQGKSCNLTHKVMIIPDCVVSNIKQRVDSGVRREG